MSLTRILRSTLAPLFALAASLAAIPAHASFLSGDALDAMANVIAIIVLILVPVIGIVVFWLVHVLPETIAEKRHHPQQGRRRSRPFACSLARFRWPALAACVALGSFNEAHRLSHGLRHGQGRQLARGDGREGQVRNAASRRPRAPARRAGEHGLPAGSYLPESSSSSRRSSTDWKGAGCAASARLPRRTTPDMGTSSS